MVRRDALWKGILEDLVEDVLQFFFAKYADQIDFSQGFEFLDKRELGHIASSKGIKTEGL